MGVSRESLPASTSCIAATEVMGLVMEASQKEVAAETGGPFGEERPAAPWNKGASGPVMAAAIEGTSPLATALVRRYWRWARLMRRAPVFADADFHYQRHGKFRCRLHDFLRQRRRGLSFAIRGLEQQFVMHLQDQP
jgi:hypothetical protein